MSQSAGWFPEAARAFMSKKKNHGNNALEMYTAQPNYACMPISELDSLVGAHLRLQLEGAGLTSASGIRGTGFRFQAQKAQYP